jgi:hypothetical protein
MINFIKEKIMKRVLPFLFVAFFVMVSLSNHPCFGATGDVLYKTGTNIVVANDTYSPGTNTILGTRTDDIDCASLAAAAARQGVKIDLGATRAIEYDVRMTVEIALDPAAGGAVDLYWFPSHSTTAAVGNMGGTTGADAAYTGYSTIGLSESLKQGKHIGSLLIGINNDADGVQIGRVGRFSPTDRYGCLVVVNNTNQAFHSDSVEFAVLMAAIITQVEQ